MPADADAPRIDLHLHLAGAGSGDSGCWVSPVFRKRLTFRLLRLQYRISARRLAETGDQDWARMVSDFVAQSELDYAVALGFDGVYDGSGRLDRQRSQMIVPPRWVIEVCRRHPNLLPGPSVNPHRRDALERLDECIEGGAVLIKWLPITQAINPADRRIRPFYERLAAAGVALLIHMGGERTFGTVAPELNDVRLLAAPLEAGVPVVCAHTATPILFSGETTQVPILRSLLREFPNLWVDNSGLPNPGRFAHLPGLVDDALIRDRTLYGSDFPVPSNSFYYLPRLGTRAVLELERIRNPLDRDIAIKRRMGYPDVALTRAATVLPRLAARLAAARA